MRKRTRRSAFTRMIPELVKELVGLLFKIFVESVKDKVVRAILIGIVSSAGGAVYISNEDVKAQLPSEVSIPLDVKKPL